MGSGYRTIHRERLHEDGAPIWQVQACPSKDPTRWSVWTGSGDGLVRIHCVEERQLQDGSSSGGSGSDDLSASALSIRCSHVLVGTQQPQNMEDTVVGCTQLSLVRNYVGEDDNAGDWVAASLDLTGRVRVWSVAPDDLMDDIASQQNQQQQQQQQPKPKRIVCLHDFAVENATGTVMAVCPPHAEGSLVLAVARFDGSVAVVATGLGTPKAKHIEAAGTVISVWGGNNSGSHHSGVCMSVAWHPTVPRLLAVGRRDGTGQSSYLGPNTGVS